MAEVARANDQLILGPNTIGLINRPGRVVLFGSPNGAPIRQGPIGSSPKAASCSPRA